MIRINRKHQVNCLVAVAAGGGPADGGGGGGGGGGPADAAEDSVTDGSRR